MTNRGPVLRIIDGVGEGGWGSSPAGLPENAIEFPIKIEKDVDGEPSLAIEFDTVPWDDAQPGQPWSMDLFPFDAGVARSKMANRRSYAFIPGNAADASNPDVLVPAPNDVSLTLTSAAAQGICAVQFTDSGGAAAIYCIAGTSVYKINSSYSVSNERALGATGTWITVIAGELFACVGGSGYIQKRTASGTWSTSSDVRAYCMTVVKDKVCRVGGSTAAIDNQYSECSALGSSAASNAMVLSNYNTAAGYYVGDLSWQVHSIWDFAGTVACGRGDGLFMPNTETKFLNQTPQIAKVANAQNCKGSFWGLSYFWVPYVRGLLRLGPGFAEARGPESLELPNAGLTVRGGFEWDRAIWLLCTNDDGADNSEYLVKMVPDRMGISDADYIFHVIARKAISTSHPGQFMVPFAGPAGPTQPSIVFGGGSAATAAGYIMLGRGTGRSIEDTGYRFKSTSTIGLGSFSPDPYGMFTVRLVGFRGYMTTTSSKPISVNYDISSAAVPSSSASSATTTTTSREGGGSSDVTSTGAFTLYAATDAITESGFFRASVQLEGNGTSSTAHARLHRITAFGYMHPKTTDQITMRLDMSAFSVRANGAGMVWSDDSGIAWLRRQAHTGRVFVVQIPGYEEGRTTRVFVKNVKGSNTKTRSGPGVANSENEYTVTVTLVRVDFANSYASGTGVTP